MATAVITSNFNIISPCEVMDDALGEWTFNSGEPDASIFKQGSASLVGIVTGAKPDITYALDSSIDLSSTHVRVWYFTLNGPVMNTKAAGGCQLSFTDGANTCYWNILGSDTYEGGWYLIIVDTDSDPDSGTKPDMSAITEIGVVHSFSGAPKNFDNTWIDLLCYGSGYMITGGSGGDKIDWSDVAVADAQTTDGWGLIQKINDVYFVNGVLTFGTVTGTQNCYFHDTGQVIVFPPSNVGAGFYELIIEGNSTGTTDIQLGNESGGAGIQGCLIKSAVGKYCYCTASGSNIDNFNIYGSIFQKAYQFDLSDEATSSGSLISCNFEECGMVVSYDNPIQYCKFISPIGYTIWMEPDHDISDSEFITCASGIYITTSGTYVLDNLKFTGCTYDIVNDTGCDITVQCTNGSNASSSINLQGGSVTIENAVTLTLTDLIANSEVRIYAHGTQTELDGIENCSTEFEFTYNYVASTYVDVVVLHLDYEYYRVNNYLLASTATSLPIAQRKDRWYDNP